MWFARRSVAARLVMGMTLFIGTSHQAVAEEKREEKQLLCPICSTLEDRSTSYGEKAGNTLARGMLNLTLGWTEMIRQPGKAAREGKGVLHGLANGVAFSARRTLRGLGEVFTFWTPKTTERYIHFSKDCPLDTLQ